MKDASVPEHIPTKNVVNPSVSSAADAPPTKARYGVLAYLSGMMFILYLDRYCISQAAPMIEKDLGFDHDAMGLVFGAFTLSYAVFEYWTGHLGDKYGSRRVMTRIVVWWSFFTALTAAVTGFWSLILVRFLFGAGEAGALPNSARILKHWFPESVRGQIQGFVTTFMMAGGAAAPIVSQQLFNVMGWRWVFVLFGVVGLIWSTAFYLWFRDHPREHPSANEAECRLISGKTDPTQLPHVEIEALAPDLAEVTEPEDHHPAMPWGLVLRNPNVWLLAFAMATMSAFAYALLTWYPTYLQEGRGVSKNYSGTLSSLVLATGAFGTMFGGWLNDWLLRKTGNERWGRTFQSLVGAVLCGMGILLGVSADSLGWSAVFIAIANFGVQLQVPAWWSCATKISGRHLGGIFGLMNMVGASGAFSSQFGLGKYASMMKEQGMQGRAIWDTGLYVYVGVAVVGFIIWTLVDPRKTVEESRA